MGDRGDRRRRRRRADRLDRRGVRQRRRATCPRPRRCRLETLPPATTVADVDVPRPPAATARRRPRPPLRDACRATFVVDDASIASRPCVSALAAWSPCSPRPASSSPPAATTTTDVPVLDTSPTAAARRSQAPDHRRSTPASRRSASPPSCPTELVVTDLIEGTGEPAKKGDTITVNYVGVRSEDGTEFDNSYDRGQPYTLTLGEGGVIQGWDEGLIGVKAGGRRQLDIPAALAYGDQGAGDVDQARRRALVRDRRRVDHTRPGAADAGADGRCLPIARRPTARRRSSRSSRSTRRPAST